MNEIKLQNMVLDLKKVESADSINDLMGYAFENPDDTLDVNLERDFINGMDCGLTKTTEWLQFQSALIFRLEKAIIDYVKSLY